MGRDHEVRHAERMPAPASSWIEAAGQVIPPLVRRHLPEPRAPPDLARQQAPIRVAETIRYTLATVEYTVAPDGLLRWLALASVRLGAVLGVGWLAALVLLQVVILLVQVAIGAVVIAVCVQVLKAMAAKR
jgi:hypothetical protein